MGFATSQPRLPVQARALQGSAVRGPSLGLRVQSEALFSLLYSTRLLQAIDIWMSKGCPHLCALCVFHHANEFAGVEAVASDAAGGGSAIYQTKTVSPGSPKGKKHGSLCRLLPPPFPPTYVHIFHPRSSPNTSPFASPAAHCFFSSVQRTCYSFKVVFVCREWPGWGCRVERRETDG